MMTKKIMGTEVEYNFHLVPPLDERDFSEIWLIHALLWHGKDLGGISSDFARPINTFFNWWGRASDRDVTGHLRELSQVLGISGLRLPNGSRFYRDNAFPEYSTPECLSLRDLVAHEKAGESILVRAAEKLSEEMNIHMMVFKKNSDRQGSSYGCHENYLLSRASFETLVRTSENWGPGSWILATFLVTRQIFAGSGKVGSEDPCHNAAYQLSQRADFIQNLSAIETTHSRPIINLRDTPYADSRKYGRLHLILGDANMSEYAIFLKMGSTALVLGMLEDLGEEISQKSLAQMALIDPVVAMGEISRDLTLSNKFRTTSGARASAIDLQYIFLDATREWYKSRYIDQYGRNIEYEDVFLLWARALDGLSRDPESVADILDAWIKKRLIEELLLESGYGLPDILRQGEARDLALSADFLYHAVNKEESYYSSMIDAGLVQRLISEEEVERAIVEPPDTRAFLRSRLITYLAQIGNTRFGTSWHGVYFESGRKNFGFKLPDPLRGGRDDTAYVLQDLELEKIARRLKEVYP